MSELLAHRCTLLDTPDAAAPASWTQFEVETAHEAARRYAEKVAPALGHPPTLRVRVESKGDYVTMGRERFPVDETEVFVCTREVRYPKVWTVRDWEWIHRPAEGDEGGAP